MLVNSQIEDVMEKIKLDIISASRRYYSMPETKAERLIERKEIINEYMENLQQRAVIKGYAIKRVKLPRKLKKQYKKYGIYPVEVYAVT